MTTSFRIFLLVAVFSLACFSTATCESEESIEDTNSSIPQDLYVIKTVVYEVGILTDAANATDNSTETHEEVDVSFFNPSDNGTGIDLSKIPVPIQTNVSGVTVTGILPGLGGIVLPPGLVPVLPQKQVTVTQNLSTLNPEKGSQIIQNLPQLLGLTKKEGSTEGPAKN